MIAMQGAHSSTPSRSWWERAGVGAVSCSGDWPPSPHEKALLWVTKGSGFTVMGRGQDDKEEVCAPRAGFPASAPLAFGAGSFLLVGVSCAR